jgi:hypothetical protein
MAMIKQQSIDEKNDLGLLSFTRTMSVKTVKNITNS